MLLSACMIVKNEAQTLDKCLSSLSDVVDEIIVVDTGSSDDTVAIAKQHGAKVYSFEWVNDFARARNHSLQLAEGDWVLVIDADEYLDHDQKQGLRAFLQQTNAHGVFVTQKNYLGSLQNIVKVSPIKVMRLFRRGYQYSGVIHEQIALAVEESGRPTAEFNLDLHHLGYLNEFVTARAKSDRNRTLLQQELKRDPTNLFHRCNLIAEYMIDKDYAACADLAESTFRMIQQKPVPQWPSYAPRILLHWIIALWELGRHDQALECAQLGRATFPWLTEMKKKAAEMLAETGRWIEAEEVLMECRQQGDTTRGLVETTEGSGTYLAAMDLGSLWSWLGDDLVARKWYLQAFLENPSLEMAVMQLTYLLPADERFLFENIESRLVGSAAQWTYAEAYAVRHIPGALGVIERVEARCGASDITARARMALLVHDGVDALQRYVDDHPTEINWVRLGIYHLERDNQDAARDAFIRSGVRGEYLQKLSDLHRTEAGEWQIQWLVRDLVAMGASRLLAAWFPRAVDKRSAWVYLKHSPLGHVLTQISWRGDTVSECEQNCLRCFQNRQFDEANRWLDRAKSIGNTVTQVLLECDLALAAGDIQRARSAVYEGKRTFPNSEAIKNVSKMVHPQVDPVDLMGQLSGNQKFGGMMA